MFSAVDWTLQNHVKTFTWQTSLLFHLLSTHWLFCISSWRKIESRQWIDDCRHFTCCWSSSVFQRGKIAWHLKQRCNCFGYPTIQKPTYHQKEMIFWKIKGVERDLKTWINCFYAWIFLKNTSNSLSVSRSFSGRLFLSTQG